MMAAQKTEGKCQPASLDSRGGDEVPVTESSQESRQED